MINTLLGTKSNMSSVYNQLGHQVPITTIMAEPNIVFGMRDKKIILGVGKKKKSKKTENAFIKVVGYSPKFIREVALKQKTSEEDKSPKSLQQEAPENLPEEKRLNLGDKVTVSIFKEGDEVKITGTTKGKGFAGGVKRWGFAGGPKTHGQSDRHRAIGSIGAGTTPGRVFKGKKMAGHMGHVKLTVTGLEVMKVDESKNLLFIKGAVPGAKNGLLVIEKTGQVKGYTQPPPPSEEKQAAVENDLGPRGQEMEAKTATTENIKKKHESIEKSAKAESNTKPDNNQSVKSEEKEKQNA